MPDPTTPPEGQPPAGPDWSAFEQAGITPDNAQEVLQAYEIHKGLNNLDTRGQYLQRVVNPQYDGQFIRQMVEPQQEPADPWAEVRQPAAEPEPEYYEPQGFDPSVLPGILDPVLDQRDRQVEERVFARLNQMAAEQHVKETAQQAVKDANLPTELADMVEFRVQAAQRMQPNRQAGDLAREITSQLATTLLGWKATPPATPAPTASVPGGPVPGEQRPRTMEEALEYSRQHLNP